MLKIYIMSYIICFITTMIVLAVILYEEKRLTEREMRESVTEIKPMEKKDKILLPLRMIAISAVVSVIAPMTLAVYVFVFISIVATTR